MSSTTETFQQHPSLSLALALLLLAGLVVGLVLLGYLIVLISGRGPGAHRQAFGAKGAALVSLAWRAISAATLGVLRPPGGRGGVGPTRSQTFALRAARAAVDITRRALDEESEVEREALLRSALRVGRIGTWRWHIGPDRIEWDARFRETLGVEGNGCNGSRQLLRSVVDSQDRGRVLQFVNALTAQREDGVIQWRAKRPDGETRDILTRAEAMRNDAGEITGLVGVVIDVTQQLQISHRHRLADHALCAAGEGIVITDHDRRIVFANAAYARIVGVSVATLLEGARPEFLQREDDSFRSASQMWALDVDEDWTGEVWVANPDGAPRPVMLTISAMAQPESFRPTNFVLVLSDLSRHKAFEQRLEELATRDQLTGLPNRASFERTLARRLDGGSCAVFLVDLDDFKIVNESIGYFAGDELLTQVAIRLRQAVRETDVVARFGGDEFVVLVAPLGSTESVAQFAEQLRRALRTPVRVNERTLYCTASIGVALSPLDGRDAETVIKHADAATYQAKRDGRNRARFFDPVINARLVDHLALVSDLRSGVQREQFLVHYQPIVDLASGSVRGFEALVRWHHPDKGVLSPDYFIDIAEESGLINEIGEFVLDGAIAQLARWRQRRADLRVSVNLSAVQLRRPDVVETISRALEQRQVNPSRLLLEITETAVMQDPSQAAETLARLRALGVRIAIDDFGTGYSSLNYIKRFQVDALKLDRSFVDGLPQSAADWAIARTVLTLANSLGIEVIAEGVEQEAQRGALIDLGFSEGQGFLFGPPTPPGEGRWELCEFPDNVRTLAERL